MATPINSADIIGTKFGYLVPVSYAGKRRDRHMYLCRCVCGTELKVGRSNLRSGGTLSCGCKTLEMLIQKRTRHGMHRSRTYRIWTEMIQRCHNPNTDGFHAYGGRGISVCESWRRFENFLADMGKAPAGLQIDRRDNNLGYSKDNCRWVTPKVNSRNTRSNVLITWKGETRCVSEWSEVTGINRETIRYRFHQGWQTEEIFSTSDHGRKRARATSEKRA